MNRRQQHAAALSEAGKPKKNAATRGRPQRSAMQN